MSETPIEIDVHEMSRLLREQPDKVFLLDVREPDEIAICRIAGSTVIPMGEIPSRLNELPKDRQILVHCHHGGRSMRVTQFLRARGFANTTNIAGGIDAWSLEIDPTVARY